MQRAAETVSLAPKTKSRKRPPQTAKVRAAAACSRWHMSHSALAISSGIMRELGCCLETTATSMQKSMRERMLPLTLMCLHAEAIRQQ